MPLLVRSRGLAPWIAWLVVALGGALAAQIVIPATRSVGLALQPVVILASLPVVPIALRLNRAPAPTPWIGFWIAGVLFALANLGRLAVANSSDAIRILPELLVVAGFLVGFWGFAHVLRRRRGRSNGTATDALLVVTIALVLGWVLVVSPTLSHGSFTAFEAVEMTFPVFDAVMLYLCLRLAITETQRLACIGLLTTTIGLILLVDLTWALRHAGFITISDAGILALGVPAFTCFAASALHPSIKRFTVYSDAPIKPLGPARIAGTAAALGLPVLVAVARPDTVGIAFVALLATAVTLVLVTVRVVRAVNEHARAEAQMRYRALHDPLTGLPNRMWFLNHIDEELAQLDADVDTFTIAVVDLDEFQYINDSYGHVVGDELLIAVARRLREKMAGAPVARIGGDEFAIAVPSTAGDDLPQTITAALDAPFELEGLMAVHVAAAIGITASPRGVRTTGLDLLREADTALSRARRDAPNRAVHFAADMRLDATHRLETEGALRQALARSELEVFYQPIVDIESGSWKGAEALLRWRHPERGLVPPAEFIPIAEDTGLIVDVGAFVVREACRQMAEWRRNFHKDWTISVNLSPRQLRNRDINPTIRDALRAAGLPGRALTIELTESLLVSNDKSAMAPLLAIKASGAMIAIDDFGTGYSSLSYLKRFPVDRVKIDRSFVVGLGSGDESEALVAAILGMTKALGIGTVAEGIETEEQRAELLGLGCTTGQGYLFARPMDAASMEALIQARAAGTVSPLEAERVS